MDPKVDLRMITVEMVPKLFLPNKLVWWFGFFYNLHYA